MTKDNKEWHHLVREDGSVSLYYTKTGLPGAHFVVFDTLDADTLRAQADGLAAALERIIKRGAIDQVEEQARAALEAYKQGKGE